MQQLACLLPEGETIITDLIRIIYVSQPFGYDVAILGGILLDARRNNTRDGITGALICRHDIYLQLLEGPETPVQAAFERIRRDDRHVGLRKVVSRHVTERIFGDWAMLHDPEKSLIWTQAQVSQGVLESATPADFEKVFEDLVEKVKNDPPN